MKFHLRLEFTFLSTALQRSVKRSYSSLAAARPARLERVHPRELDYRSFTRSLSSVLRIPKAEL